MTAKIISATLAASLTIASAQAQDKTPGYNHKIPEKIMTPDKVETSIGTLEFFDGMPLPETVDKLYDNLLLMRGVETFLNGIPATSIEGLRGDVKRLFDGLRDINGRLDAVNGRLDAINDRFDAMNGRLDNWWKALLAAVVTLAAAVVASNAIG